MSPEKWILENGKNGRYAQEMDEESCFYCTANPLYEYKRIARWNKNSDPCTQGYRNPSLCFFNPSSEK